MPVIWKFPLDHKSGPQTVKGPGLGVALHFDHQVGELFAWMKVHPGEDEVERRLLIAGTGHEIPDDWRHVGSVQSGGFVWHLFQEWM
jgi:hypothetical protein